MFHGNAQHTGLSPYDTSAKNYVLKWKFHTGSNAHSSPAIDSDGTIYVAVHTPSYYSDYLYAVNPDGTPKWKFKFRGVDSSPAIGSDGTIYMSAHSEFSHYIYYICAVNPNGTFKWEFKFSKAVVSSPAIGSDGTIYVASSNGYGCLYALEKDTDGDGVGDNSDAFPNDPSKWRDTDGDGAGGNSDFLSTINSNVLFGIIIFIGIIFTIIFLCLEIRRDKKYEKKE